MATVAAEIGYGSEAAFSRAFKKILGYHLRLGAAGPRLNRVTRTTR